MKRLILAISSILYLSTAIGANLHLHYCMGELASWSFEYNKDKACGKCGMEKRAASDSGCCKDELKHIKLKSDQKSHNFVVYQFFIAESESQLPFVVTSNRLEDGQNHNSLTLHHPPRGCCIATYIRHCNFRI